MIWPVHFLQYSLVTIGSNGASGPPLNFRVDLTFLSFLVSSAFGCSNGHRLNDSVDRILFEGLSFYLTS